MEGLLVLLGLAVLALPVLVVIALVWTNRLSKEVAALEASLRTVQTEFDRVRAAPPAAPALPTGEGAATPPPLADETAPSPWIAAAPAPAVADGGAGPEAPGAPAPPGSRRTGSMPFPPSR